MENQMALLEESDIKFITDSKGNRKEVIISYDKFKELMQLIEDYVFLHSPEHDSEHEGWLILSGQRLEDAYGEDEPEYSLDLLKEVNPYYETR